MASHNKNQGQGDKSQKNISGDMDVPTGSPITEAPQNVMQRTFSATRKIIVDLYKLEIAKVLKRTGMAYEYHDNPQDFTEYEHTHPYRTYDSDGKKLHRSASIAGHYHVIELGIAEKEGQAPPILSVSGPMRLARKKHLGKWIIVDEPINNHDTHTHDWTYLRSGEVAARMTNIEAQKVIAFEAQKGAKVPGVADGGAR